MGERKKDIEAERDALAKQAEKMARNLQTLSENIEAAIVAVPRWTKPSAVALLQQQADRAHAFAVALAVESKDPNPKTTRLLLSAWKPLGAALLYALTAISTGGLEHVGAEGVDRSSPHIEALTVTAAEMAEQLVIAPKEPARVVVKGGTATAGPVDQPARSGMRGYPITFGAALRHGRQALGISQAKLARELGVGQTIVSKWERDQAKPGHPRAAVLRAVLESEAVRHQEHAEDLAPILSMLSQVVQAR